MKYITMLFQYRIAAAVNPPDIFYIEDNCNSKDCFKGIDRDVWHILSEKMNFTYTVQKEDVYGSFINGSWKGMIGINKYVLKDY